MSNQNGSGLLGGSGWDTARVRRKEDLLVEAQEPQVPHGVRKGSGASKRVSEGGFSTAQEKVVSGGKKKECFKSAFQ